MFYLNVRIASVFSLGSIQEKTLVNDDWLIIKIYLRKEDWLIKIVVYR